MATNQPNGDNMTDKIGNSRTNIETRTTETISLRCVPHDYKYMRIKETEADRDFLEQRRRNKEAWDKEVKEWMDEVAKCVENEITHLLWRCV